MLKFECTIKVEQNVRYELNRELSLISLIAQNCVREIQTDTLDADRLPGVFKKIVSASTRAMTILNRRVDAKCPGVETK